MLETMVRFPELTLIELATLFNVSLTTAQDITHGAVVQLLVSRSGDPDEDRHRAFSVPKQFAWEWRKIHLLKVKYKEEMLAQFSDHNQFTPNQTTI
jgi:hypothetical protein